MSALLETDTSGAEFSRPFSLSQLSYLLYLSEQSSLTERVAICCSWLALRFGLMRLIRSQRLSGKEDTGIVGTAVLKIEQTWWGSVAWRRNHFLSAHGLFTVPQNKASHDRLQYAVLMSSIYFSGRPVFYRYLQTPNRSNQSKEESVIVGMLKLPDAPFR